jgi:uncharacterized protein involved in exopolysaccharide biosynthesis
MSEALVLNAKNDEMQTYTAREVVAILFRHRRLAALCFIAVFIAGIIASILLPAYNAEMKFLVKRERVDPVISGDQSTSQIQMTSPEISEQEMNSEAELLTSEDVLRQVVLANHLEQQIGSSWFHSNSPERKIALAIRKLRSHLQVEAVRKANIIDVTLSSSNPQQAARVLQSLATFYLDEHTRVNRPGGQFAFFEKETGQAKTELRNAEKKLQRFNQKQGVAAPELERDTTLQKLAEMTLSLEQTKAAVRETRDRITTLEGLRSSTPARITTQLRHGDNPQLMQQLKSTLLNLELKRTELLTKYQPSYPLVTEVDTQIAETQSAINAENLRPVSEETTDQNPTGQWVLSELAKARADLSGLNAREIATEASVGRYQAQARLLEDKDIVQQDLVRSAKAAEQNYLLYLKKREESRISDALDRGGILNIAIAQEPSAPALPAHSGDWYLLLGIAFAVFVAAGATFVAEYFDDTFRTPEEMRRGLNVPLIAAIPYCRALALGTGISDGLDGGKEVA